MRIELTMEVLEILRRRSGFTIWYERRNSDRNPKEEWSPFWTSSTCTIEELLSDLHQSCRVKWGSSYNENEIFAHGLEINSRQEVFDFNGMSLSDAYSVARTLDTLAILQQIA